MDGAVQFTDVDGARVGYATHGSGDLDLIYAPGFATHLDLTLEQPRYVRYIEALSRYGRVIRFDRRGAGVSDPVPADADEGWEIWADDLGAVLEACGSERAAIIAANDAGPGAILFAATHPDLVQALVLFNTTARFTATDDYPEGHPPEVGEVIGDAIRSTWGSEDTVNLLAPSLAADEGFRRWYSRFQRAACSPAVMGDNMARLFRMDGRAVLPEVRSPTLVVHREAYGAAGPDHGRYIANHIPGAIFELVPGADAPIYTEGMEPIVARIGEFLGRSAEAPDDSSVFGTVLFTDIVDSTRLAVDRGDAAWRSLLDAHDSAALEAIASGDGRLIKTTGDGVLARFEAPSRAVRSAQAIHERASGLGIKVRAGLHAGQITVRGDGDISGVAVNVAARVMGVAGDSETLISGGVADLLTGDEYAFEDRGERELKGIPDPQRLFAVASAG